MSQSSTLLFVPIRTYSPSLLFHTPKNSFSVGSPCFRFLRQPTEPRHEKDLAFWIEAVWYRLSAARNYQIKPCTVAVTRTIY